MLNFSSNHELDIVLTNYKFNHKLKKKPNQKPIFKYSISNGILYRVCNNPTIIIKILMSFH